VWFWLAGVASRRYITGAIDLAINVPFGADIVFNAVAAGIIQLCVDNGIKLP
jgi:hypothetical protein